MSRFLRRGKKKPITAQDNVRFTKLKEHGCMCCKKLGREVYAEIHHLLSGQRRIGHQATIPLCAWHHRGSPLHPDLTVKQTERMLGPSLALNKRAFNETWGTEQELLQEIEDWLNA